MNAPPPSSPPGAIKTIQRIGRLALIILCLIAGWETLNSIRAFTSYQGPARTPTSEGENETPSLVDADSLMAGNWQFDEVPCDISLHDQQPAAETPVFPKQPSLRPATDLDRQLTTYLGLLNPKIETLGEFRTWSATSPAMELSIVTSQSDGEPVVESASGWIKAGDSRYFRVKTRSPAALQTVTDVPMLPVLADALLVATRRAGDGRVLGGIYESPRNVESLLEDCRREGYKTWHQPGIISNGQKVFMIANKSQSLAMFRLGSSSNLTRELLMVIDAAGLTESNISPEFGADSSP